VRKLAESQGMVPIRQSGLEKLFSGVTSLKDLNKVTFVE